MDNGFQRNQGFGNSAQMAELLRLLAQQQQQQQLMEQGDPELAQQLAGLPDTDLGYDWLQSEQPQGRMVGNHFVAPSMAQHVTGAMKQGLGGMMVNRRGKLAGDMAKYVAQRYQQPTGAMSAGSMSTDPHEVDARYGG